ncbi:MAG: dihydrofolate reductase [Saprospiraceae bacterium]|nr:dihydrofolate reductase [Saprospiraceae bacterium]MCF8251596.1 dihydrofolate reductase [Saprospiraceae bacterium]MCF8313491.1 dihydrofolate reductase [Saprospiraceae bacterium]MCF8442232.1 dihydrofolate reductase [Saprospiraceae bacterium]
MIVSAIVATARNLVIGHENQIPWYLPADLKYFKKMTTGHHVIMGRKSFQSIGRPLPNRTNVIITRDLFFVATGCTIVHSLEEALELAEANGETEAFIIGGGEIYHKSWPYLDRLYLTEVDTEPEGDVFFPAVNEMEWRELSSEAHPADEKNEFGFVFRILERV